MSETESEKVVKDTIRRMDEGGTIVWGQKLWQSGGKYSKRAPIDFLVLDGSGRSNYIEVKETGKTTLPFGNFDEKQREILNQQSDTTDFYIIARFYSSDYNRNNSHYWEHYFLLPGHYAPDIGESGSIKLSNLYDDEDVSELASYDHTGSKGFAEGAGLTSRGNDSKGLLYLHPLLME